MQKLTFCKNSLKIFLQFLAIFTLLTCSNSQRELNISEEPIFRLGILIGNKKIKICLTAIQIEPKSENKCKLNEKYKLYPCNTISTEDSIFNIPQREAADIIVRGISEVLIKNPKISRKIEKTIVLQLEQIENKANEGEKKFLKFLEDILVKNKISVVLKNVEKDTFSNFFMKSSTIDFGIENKNFYILYTGETIFHLLKVIDGKVEGTVREDLGSDTLFDNGEKYRREFFTCRQIISESFKTYNSGWENYEDCKSYISNRFNEKIPSQKITEFTKNSPDKIYVSGDIWTDLSIYIGKKNISYEDIKKSIRNTCKISTLELLEKKYSKEIASKLCYDVSFAGYLLNSLSLNSLEVIPTDWLAYSSGMYVEFIPECGNQPLKIDKKIELRK